MSQESSKIVQAAGSREFFVKYIIYLRTSV